MWLPSDAGLIERLVVFKHLGSGYVPAGEIVVDGPGLGRFGVRGAPREMYKRFLLNSWIRNTDDHLRNHGFTDDGIGWCLSPIFDIVTQVGGLRHVCAPTRDLGPAWDPARAFEAHVGLGVGRAEAEAIRNAVRTAADRLPEFMQARGVAAWDRDLVLAALRHPT